MVVFSEICLQSRFSNAKSNKCYSYTPRTLRACCSQSEFRILKIRESSARALFLCNCNTGDLHIWWSTSCPPVVHRMSHPHASGNVPEVVHRMCRIRWTTGCAASGGPLDVCMRWTTRCVHAVDHWMCACSAVVCTWWKSDGQPDVSIEWLAFGVLCSLSLFMGK